MITELFIGLGIAFLVVFYLAAISEILADLRMKRKFKYKRYYRYRRYYNSE